MRKRTILVLTAFLAFATVSCNKDNITQSEPKPTQQSLAIDTKQHGPAISNIQRQAIREWIAKNHDANTPAAINPVTGIGWDTNSLMSVPIAQTGSKGSLLMMKPVKSNPIATNGFAEAFYFAESGAIDNVYIFSTEPSTTNVITLTMYNTSGAKMMQGNQNTVTGAYVNIYTTPQVDGGGNTQQQIAACVTGCFTNTGWLGYAAGIASLWNPEILAVAAVGCAIYVTNK